MEKNNSHWQVKEEKNLIIMLRQHKILRQTTKSKDGKMKVSLGEKVFKEMSRNLVNWACAVLPETSRFFSSELTSRVFVVMRTRSVKHREFSCCDFL